MIQNTQQDFDTAQALAEQYSQRVSELYLVQSYVIKRDCAERGVEFDKQLFDTAFNQMIVDLEEA